METTVLGYPRTGPRHELARATAAFAAGRGTATDLAATARDVRRETWETLREAGLTGIPSNTFSLVDHVLDTAAMVGAVPGRFAGLTGLESYFAMAGGAAGIAPLRQARWFGTNYHYLVPELGPGTNLRLAGDKPLREYLEALELGIETRPVLLGPVSFLLQSSPAEPGFRPLVLLDLLLDAYLELLGALDAAGCRWVQLDEPVPTCNRTRPELEALRHAYHRLGSAARRPALMVSTSFGAAGAALPVLAASPVEAIGLDFVAGPGNREGLADIGGLGRKTLVAGVVDARNVWQADVPAAIALCTSLLGLAGSLTVSTSCSLLHVPPGLGAGPSAGPGLAFARQKVSEVVSVGRALADGGHRSSAPDGTCGRLPAATAR